jgi:Ca2+-binding EF-hand superfamily protein
MYLFATYTLILTTSKEHRSGSSRRLRSVRQSIAQQLKVQQRGAPMATAVDWAALCEEREDGEGSGKISSEALADVFKDAGLRLKEEELQILARKFGSKNKDGTASNIIACNPLVRWLEDAEGPSDRLLKRIQRHVNARLNRGFDLRAFYMSMSRGESRLSRKGLNRGLKTCGLRLSPELLDELMCLVAQGDDGPWGRAQNQRETWWDFQHFHRLMHAETLADLESSKTLSPSTRFRLNLTGTQRVPAIGGADGVPLDTIMSTFGNEGDEVENLPGLATARADKETYGALMTALEKVRYCLRGCQRN